MLNCISCMLWIKFLFHKHHCIWQGFNFNGNIACHLSLSWIMLWVLHLKTHYCSQGHNFQEFYNFASHIYIHDLLQINIWKICVQIDLFFFCMCMYRHLGTTRCKDNLSILLFLLHSYWSFLDFLFTVLLIYLSIESLDDHSFIISLEAEQCQGSSLVLLQCCQPSLYLGLFRYILEPFHQHPQFTC